MDLRNRALSILKEEARLQNIVKLIGEDALPDDQKAIFYGAGLIKEDFLQQSAFDVIDTYSIAEKQVMMLQLILQFIDGLREAVRLSHSGIPGHGTAGCRRDSPHEKHLPGR